MYGWWMCICMYGYDYCHDDDGWLMGLCRRVVPKGAFPQGFAPDGLLNGLPTDCWLATVGLPLSAFGPQLACRSRLAAPLGLSVCRCRPSGRSRLTAPASNSNAQCLCSKKNMC